MLTLRILFRKQKLMVMTDKSRGIQYKPGITQLYIY